MSKPKYEMIIYWSEADLAYVVDVPELEGCMADGRTYQEAVKQAEKAIRTWLEIANEEGWDIPHPKGRLKYA